MANRLYLQFDQDYFGLQEMIFLSDFFGAEFVFTNSLLSRLNPSFHGR